MSNQSNQPKTGQTNQSQGQQQITDVQAVYPGMGLVEYESEQKTAKDNSWCLHCHRVIDPDKEHEKKKLAQYLVRPFDESCPEPLDNFFVCFDCTIREKVANTAQVTDFMNSNPPPEYITPGQEELTTAYGSIIRNHHGKDLFDVTTTQISSVYSSPRDDRVKKSATILIYGDMEEEGLRYLDIAIKELSKFTEDRSKIGIVTNIANASLQNCLSEK